MTDSQTIHIEPLAPTKPAFGQQCNGCGVCCLAEPCPLGMLISRRRRGACDALRWNAAVSMYRCGAIDNPVGVWRTRFPRVGQLIPAAVVRLLAPLARRWIATGSGCDCALEVIGRDGHNVWRIDPVSKTRPG